MAGTRKEAGPSSERVAANTRRIRRDQELTTAALSQRLGEIGHPIADTGITKIEKGTRRVDVDDLMALALALGVTPNVLLLPEVDFANPRETIALTQGKDKVRAEEAWAWAYGERPLGHKPASFRDDSGAREELRFVGRNRRYYARGGFGWLSSVGDWVDAVADQDGAAAEKARGVSDEVEGSGLIAGAILGAFVKYGLNTRQIRAACESGVMAAIVPDSSEDAERAFREVLAWLAAHGGDEDEDG